MSKPSEHDDPQQPGREQSFTFPASAEAVPVARAALSKTLCDWGFGQIAEDLVLCLSEAVTNALLHGEPGGNITVHATATEHTVHIEVNDGDDAEPQLQAPVTAGGQGVAALAAVPTGGYGLVLIKALSTAWGVRHLPFGKAVWFERDASKAVTI